MQKNLLASIVQTLVFLVFIALTWVRSCQIDGYESKLISMNKDMVELTKSVNHLKYQLESGGIAVRGGPPAGSAGDAAPGAPKGEAISQRYFPPDEWKRLREPGNYLVPTTESVRVDGAVDGGTLQRAFISDIPGLNPLTENGADVSELYSYVTESLATRQRSDPSRWIPGLAYRIEVSDDFKTYRVFLKKGVRWHPPAVDLTDERYAWLRGDRYVTADDFVFYLELVRNPQVEAAFLRNYFEQCEGIEVINDHEFVVRWKEPVQHSIRFTVGLPPMPRWLYAFDEDGKPYDPSELGRRFNSHWYNQRAIGVGPYRFVKWEQGGVIELERFSGYHGELPPIEKIQFRVVNDATARLNNLRAGGLDYIPLLASQYKTEVIDGGTANFKDGSLEQGQFQGTTYRYLGWNADGKFFADRRVRTAMTLAFNRQQALDQNMSGLGRLVSGSSFIDGPYYDQSIEPLPFDPKRAAELLDEAGWKDANNDGIREKIIDGQPVRFEFGMMTYGYRPEFVAAMESFRNDLKRVGIIMRIEPVEWAVMVRRMESKDFDAFTGGWQLVYGEEDPYQIWHSSQADIPRGSNRVGFRNAEADKIIEQLRLTFDEAERIRLLHRFHRIVHDEQPYTFWFSPLEVGAWRARVGNVNFSPLRPFDLSMNWYLEN